MMVNHHNPRSSTQSWTSSRQLEDWLGWQKKPRLVEVDPHPLSLWISGWDTRAFLKTSNRLDHQDRVTNMPSNIVVVVLENSLRRFCLQV